MDNYKKYSIKKMLNIVAIIYSVYFMLDIKTTCSWVVLFLTTIGVWYIYKLPASRIGGKYVYVIASIIFSLFTVWGGFTVDIASTNLDRMIGYISLEKLQCLLFGMHLIASYGMAFLYYRILIVLVYYYDKYIDVSYIKRRWIHVSDTYIAIIYFTIVWLEMFIFFLNIYPGSLCVDQPGQLGQVITGKYNNINPFISTALIAIACKIAGWFSSNINLGVALYTVFQLTFYACATTYVVVSIHKRRMNPIISLLSVFFFIMMPYNIIFALSMWKDTIFGLFTVITITYLWNYLDKESKRVTDKLILLILVTLTSICRNISWASFAISGCILILFEIISRIKNNNIGIIIALGFGLSMIIQFCVYPALGIGNVDSQYGASLPIQMLGKVIVSEENYKEYITKEEYDVIENIFDIDKLNQRYTADCSDNTWHSLNSLKAYEDNSKKLNSIIVKLGIKYPLVYLDEFICMTSYYWCPDKTMWLWDYRVFDNEYGVERSGLLFGNHDILKFTNITRMTNKLEGFCTAGWNLWVLLFVFMLGVIYRNNTNIYIAIPLLCMYGILIFLSPIALFRYVYQIAICLPVIVCVLLDSKYDCRGEKKEIEI